MLNNKEIVEEAVKLLNARKGLHLVISNYREVKEGGCPVVYFTINYTKDGDVKNCTHSFNYGLGQGWFNSCGFGDESIKNMVVPEEVKDKPSLVATLKIATYLWWHGNLTGAIRKGAY